MKRFVVRSGATLALLMALALPGCSGEGLLNSGDDQQAVFLVHKTPHANAMDALYEGSVDLDPQGCLRVESSGGVTVVIWPYGFNLRTRSGGLYVENADGRTVGQIGGDFRMGGGQVDAEHVDTYLSQADRTRAEVCHADKYWIANGMD